MKRIITLLSLSIILFSCSKTQPDKTYHDYWWKSQEYVDGNHKVFFHFSDNNRLEFKCSESTRSTKYFPTSNTSRTYTDNGSTIDLHDFTVTGGRSFGEPEDDIIVFHKATWKNGKPKDTSETILADLIVDYTYTTYTLTGKVDKVVDKTCTLSIISGEPE